MKFASQGQGNPVVKIEYYVEGDGGKMVWRQKAQVVVGKELGALEACPWPKSLFCKLSRPPMFARHTIWDLSWPS